MPRFIVSVDYELFFGEQTGSVSRCMIEPTRALVELLERHGARLVLFVDAGFLDRLKHERQNHPALAADYDAIAGQLRELVERGHDVQLHIHPHWGDCRFDGRRWRIDTRRYKLHDFSAQERFDIVRRYKQALVEIVGERVFAYRAGGWCIQPFDAIADALAGNGIWLDSTLYRDGLSEDPKRHFDFRAMPQADHWRFEDDPLKEVADGRFVEVPISACHLSPLFFWRMTITKLLARGDHRAFGDGRAMSYGKGYYIERLTRPTHSVASIDGLKAGALERAWRQAGGIFNVMGHPKALTPYSLKRLEAFLRAHPELEPITFRDLESLRPGAVRDTEQPTARS